MLSDIFNSKKNSEASEIYRGLAITNYEMPFHRNEVETIKIVIVKLYSIIEMHLIQ